MTTTHVLSPGSSSVVDDRGQLIVSTFGPNATSIAQLAAASPELYQSVRELSAWIHAKLHADPVQDASPILARALRALAKADGLGNT